MVVLDCLDLLDSNFGKSICSVIFLLSREVKKIYFKEFLDAKFQCFCFVLSAAGDFFAFYCRFAGFPLNFEGFWMDFLEFGAFLKDVIIRRRQWILDILRMLATPDW